LIDCLINRARPFIFTTAPAPAVAAAAAAGVRFVHSAAGEQRRNQLWANVTQISRHIESKGSAIIPILIGDEEKAMKMAAALREQAIFVPAIRFPTVARGQARLRLTVTAAHSRDDMDQLLAALRSVNLASHS
jgi:7-keto-8-aminopelargonate synthetase-like enzyme